MGKKILIVIDVQRCFLPGGSLPVDGPDTPEVFAQKVNDLIVSGGFSDVFLTQDVHHPENVSLRNMHSNVSNEAKYHAIDKNRNSWLRLGMYKNYPKVQTRRWSEDPTALDNQLLWPRHCIISPEDEYYPSGYNKSSGKQPNRVGSAYGSDLAYVLDKYKNKDDPFYKETARPKIYHVYKGFDISKDSYSAIADAVGAEDPFIARIDGVSKAPNTSLKFAKMLTDMNRNGGITDIYICGIATDFCVFQTTMDLLDLWMFSQKGAQSNKPKLHLIYDLTRSAFPAGHALHKTREDYMNTASRLLKTVGAAGEESQYFVIDDYNDVMKDLANKTVNALADPGSYNNVSGLGALFGNSNNFEGGRRRNKTRKNHKRNCGCAMCWPKPKKGGKRGTRKPMGHKKGCKCVICKRR